MAIKRLSQEDRLERVFKSRPNEYISLSDILDMRISQYGRAIHTLRHKRHMIIDNKTEPVDGETHSWFIYRPIEIQQELFQMNA